jgi:hypothetical protein
MCSLERVQVNSRAGLEVVVKKKTAATVGNQTPTIKIVPIQYKLLIEV